MYYFDITPIIDYRCKHFIDYRWQVRTFAQSFFIYFESRWHFHFLRAASLMKYFRFRCRYDEKTFWVVPRHFWLFSMATLMWWLKYISFTWFSSSMVVTFLVKHFFCQAVGQHWLRCIDEKPNIFDYRRFIAEQLYRLFSCQTFSAACHFLFRFHFIEYHYFLLCMIISSPMPWCGFFAIT